MNVATPGADVAVDAGTGPQPIPLVAQAAASEVSEAENVAGGAAAVRCFRCSRPRPPGSRRRFPCSRRYGCGGAVMLDAARSIDRRMGDPVLVPGGHSVRRGFTSAPANISAMAHRISGGVFSPLTAAGATFASKAGAWALARSSRHLLSCSPSCWTAHGRKDHSTACSVSRSHRASATARLSGHVAGRRRGLLRRLRIRVFTYTKRSD
jgi:hypothetical protein